MAKNRKRWTPQEKFQIVLELLQGRKTQAEIASEYGVSASQQSTWKSEFLRNAEKVFQDKRSKDNDDKDKKIAYLERKVGQYTMEVDWLQKKID
jgi:transposase